MSTSMVCTSNAARKPSPFADVDIPHKSTADPRLTPFAAIPHGILADPRLTPVDKCVIGALLYWARDRAICWPCDRSIAERVGRSISTVQRALRRLQAFGFLRRDQVPQTDVNRTGRVLRLSWKTDRTPGHGCHAPRSRVTYPPRSPVTDEWEKERKRERPGSDSGSESPPPPGGDGTSEAPATAEQIAEFRRWAADRNPALARFGRAALLKAGYAMESPASPPCPEPDPPGPQGPGCPESSGSEAPGPAPSEARRASGSEAPGPAILPTSRPTASPPRGPTGSGTPRSPAPRSQDARSTEIPWASVLAGLGYPGIAAPRTRRPAGP